MAARSRQLLIEYNSPSAQERRAVFWAAVAEAAEASTTGDAESRQAVMDDFVSVAFVGLLLFLDVDSYYYCSSRSTAVPTVPTVVS